MYKINIGQLITIWVTGLISALFLLNSADNEYNNLSGLYSFLIVVIIGFLPFYTIGWIGHKIKIRKEKQKYE